MYLDGDRPADEVDGRSLVPDIGNVSNPHIPTESPNIESPWHSHLLKSSKHCKVLNCLLSEGIITHPRIIANLNKSFIWKR